MSNSDVRCPYCKAGQEICHDDGYGYEEYQRHEQECSECGETFIYTTTISVQHEAFCQPDQHLLKDWAPEHPDMEGCSRCGFARRKQEAA